MTDEDIDRSFSKRFKDALIRNVEAQRPDRNSYLESDTRWFLDPAKAKDMRLYFRTREYYMDEPWLEIRFYDAEGHLTGFFLHTPGQFDVDWMSIDGMRVLRPGPQLLKSIMGVVNG